MPKSSRILQSLEDKIRRLEARVEELARLNEELRQDNARLRQENEELRRRLEEAERAAHRQAAPFRLEENKHKSDPKKPGRPVGHPGVYRACPPEVDQEIEVALESCPHCGGPVSGLELVEQVIEEIPPIRPQVTRLKTCVGHCAQCRQEVRSTHPLQVSTAEGAAKVQLGPRASALALELSYRHGLTRRKTCAVLKEMCGLRLSPGGLVQMAHRLARRLRCNYEELITKLREAAVVHADETSWWVGGPKHWLWVFTNKQMTAYRVEQKRGRDVVTETLGENFPGVLVSDCLATCDDATPRRHKCYAHHLKAIKEALEQAPDPQSREALEALRAILKGAMALKKSRSDFSGEEFSLMRQALDKNVDAALGKARLCAGAAKVANRLQKQRDHLFTFLDVPEVEATNNLAERQLRPAVIARKVSCGNKTERGARTWEVLTSLSATAAQQATDFIELIAHAARAQPALLPPR